MGIVPSGVRQRGRGPVGSYREESGVDWGGVVAQQVANLGQISSENQQTMQQLLAKTAQMVTHQEMEEVFQKRVMGRQESELIHESLERRLEQIEGQLKVQPAITRSWLMVALSAGGCLVTLLGIFTSVVMGLLIFGLQYLIK